jgi:hypothetical protein
MLRIQKRLVIWGAGILLLLLAALSATAQTATPNRANEFEITGTVTALTSTTITLRELRIQIAGAEINDSISVGALVKVHYSVGADGVRVAREVEQALNPNPNNPNDNNNPNRDDEFEITGVVSALTSTTITLDNQVIQYAGAEIKDPISVGALVKVHFSIAANGTLVAREVELALFDNGDDDNRNNGDNNGNNDDNNGDNNNNSSNSGSGSHNDDGDNDDHGGNSGHGDGDDGGSDDNGGNSGSGGGDD